MVKTSGIMSSAAYYNNSIHKHTDNIVKKNNSVSKEIVKSSEEKLSSKAKEYLNNLRKEYGDYDFMVADAGVDKKALLENSDKEFSVMFSTAEIERMANDEKYASEKMHKVKTIVDMSDRICEQFGFERAWGKNGENDVCLNKVAVSVNEDGSMSIFAELEKMSEKQKEHIEKIREKHSAEKESIGKLEEKKMNSYKKDDNFVKKVVLEASSEEEIIEKIKKVDWNKASEGNLKAKFDFTI